MSSREKRLVIILGIFAVGGLVIGLYTLVLSPWQESRAAAAKFQEELSNKSDTLTGLMAKQVKLKTLKERSLPGDPDAAQREYSALLYAMLLDCKIQGASVTEQKPADENRVPTTTGKTPAFSRTSYVITLHKVDLPKVVTFLEAYYRYPLLQQITKFSIKRMSADGNESGSKKSESRADLEVTIVTEGVSIEGTEKRETLLPVSYAFGALGGSLGLGLVQYSPPFARAIKPSILANNLAAGRDYKLLVAKDPFHGPLPDKVKEGPKAPKEPKEPEDKLPTEKPEDISPYIRLTGITWRSDGSISAEIRDMANNYDYDVSRKFTFDGVKVVVKKYFYIGAARKPLENMDEFLVITEDGTSTDRKFKVLDFLPEGLLLSERPIVAAKIEDAPKEEKKEESKGSKSGFSKGSSSKGGSKTSSTKKPDAKGPQQLGAVVGGLAFVEIRPAEERYLWKIGAPLSKIEKLPAEPKKSEEAPMPRENPQGK